MHTRYLYYHEVEYESANARLERSSVLRLTQLTNSAHSKFRSCIYAPVLEPFTIVTYRAHIKLFLLLDRLLIKAH